MSYKIINENCSNYISSANLDTKISLTFLDPPFNQGKDYNFHEDDMEAGEYWELMTEVCKKIFDSTLEGGSIYFMQREKNTENVLRCLRESKWTFQNLIIWKKKTSAIPGINRFGKHYQIIVFATRGERPRVFNRLRISPPLPPNYKYERENGIFVTDVWDDIRELTSGYFAGNEAIRNGNGERIHKQQSPIALLLRIILSSSKIGDTIFDPFAGTGTTLVVAHQLQRNSIGIEIDPQNVNCIEDRLKYVKESDLIQKYFKDYVFTDNLEQIWGDNFENIDESKHKILNLFSEQ